MKHLNNLAKSINQTLGLLRRTKSFLPPFARRTLFTVLILPLFDYNNIVWGNKNNSTLMNSLQILQNKAAKLVLDAPPLSSSTEALKTLNWTPLGIRRQKHRCIFIFKCYDVLIDSDFKLTRNNSVHNYYTRTNSDLHLPKAKTNWGKQEIIYHIIYLHNNVMWCHKTPLKNTSM